MYIYIFTYVYIYIYIYIYIWYWSDLTGWLFVGVSINYTWCV